MRFVEPRKFDWPWPLVFLEAPWFLVEAPFVLKGFVERRLWLAAFISLLKCIRFGCRLVLGFDIAHRVL